MNFKPLLFLVMVFFSYLAQAQILNPWNNKSSAVALTYDDGLDIHLDRVIPLLDSLNIKASFYLIGSSSVVGKRLLEWRKAARNGHELGNHSLNHPCDGSLPGRDFVSPDNDLSKFTVQRAVDEIKINNTLLEAIDGKKTRTFAYPCGDMFIGKVNFFEKIQNSFAGARGVNEGMPYIQDIDLNNIPSYPMNNLSADYMIDLVKKAQKNHTLLVFLFHGVGGGHNLNVDFEEHRKLLQYLSDHRSQIWIAPLVEIAQFIAKVQNRTRIPEK
jgi:sialate O-acetylesterase